MGDSYVRELCRLCLYKCDNLVDIFDINGRHGYLAAGVIQDLLQIEVGQSDGFPRCVCSVCLDKLTDFKLFKDQCLESRTTFQQEFRLEIERANRRQLRNVRVNQDPLVCSSSIKVEKPEVEIIEIPVEEEVVVKKEVHEVRSGLSSSSEASDLDVVNIDDDDDNILCLGSKEEFGFVPAVASSNMPVLLPEKASTVPPKRASGRRDRYGRYVMKDTTIRHTTVEEKPSSGAQGSGEGENRTTAMGSRMEISGLTLKDLLHTAPATSISSGPASTQVAAQEEEDPATSVHPLWLDSGEDTNRAPAPRAKTKKTGERRNRRKSSQRDYVRRKKRRSISSKTPAQETKGAKPQGRQSGMPLVDSFDGPFNGERRLSGDPLLKTTSGTTEGTQRGRTSTDNQHPLYGGEGNESSEPHWKHHKREAAAAPVYAETSILLSSGNTPQGFVDVGCLGSEMKPKKKRRRKMAIRDVAPATQTVGTTAPPLGPNTVAPIMKVKKLQKAYKCLQCDQTFKTWMLRREHLRKVHQRRYAKVKPAKCPVCKKMFSSMGALKSHEFLHSGLRPFACNLCEMGYTRWDHLKRHMAVAHQQVGDSTVPVP